MNPLCPGGWPDAYLHLLSPFAIQFTESLGIRWYGLAYLAGFYLGYLAIRWLAAHQKIALQVEQASDFVFTVALGVVVGGRLGYCLMYQPSHFWEFSSTVPFWKVLAINEGGMASHGGIAGLMISVWWFARKNKINALALLDLTSLGGTIGIFFGRIANFVNGELWGRVAPECYRFAVQFPAELLGRPDSEVRLGVLGAKLGTQGVIDAAHHGSLEAIVALREALPGRYPSQLFEALLEGLIPLLIIIWIWRVPRRPGLIATIFLLLYPLARILGEEFRMPDAHLGFQALGLTRGQWLSVAMFILSLTLTFMWRKTKAKPHGGWMSSEVTSET